MDMGIGSTFSIVVDLTRLPSIPQVLLELIEACNDDDVNLETLSAILRKDVALTSKVIAAANSPITYQRVETADLTRLLVVLGLKTVKTIIMTSAVQHFFSSFSDEYQAYLNIFWKRSLHCAHLCRSLAQLSGYHAPEEAYLVGLLHRLGQLVTLHGSPDDYLVALVDSRDGNITEELERFNTTNSEVGSWVMEHWRVKSQVVDAIRYQDEPSESMGDASQLVKILHVARRLAAPEAFEVDGPIRDAQIYFGLTRERLEELLAQIATELKGLNESLHLDPAADKGDEIDSNYRLSLARHIRDFALLSAANQPVADAEQTPAIDDFLVDMSILFGLRNTLFLCYDSKSNRLHLKESDASASDFGSFSLSVERGRSLAADALIQGKVKFSNTDKGLMSYQVIDRELSTYLGGDGLVAIPLLRSGLRIGVVLAAVDAQRSRQLQIQADFMGQFARVCCERLLQQRENEVAERQRLEEFRLRVQAEASKLTHEAGNPLAIINNYLYLLGDRLGSGHPAQEEIGFIKEEIARVGEILQRLKDTTAEIPEEGGAVDINQLVESLVMVFRASLCADGRIRCDMNLDKRIPSVHIDRNRLKQVLTNLFKNAVEAIRDTGRIEVSSKDNVNVNGRRYIEIALNDNGPGISDEVQANLFKPLKSDKAGDHSGLGLAIVKNLVDELQGSVTCRSEKGEGTRFSILLPRKIEAT